MSQDYNATVNLPKTDFPMRASLPKREPDMLQSWYDMDLYHKMLERNEGKPLFVLHDGPPFSNGYIHMGTVLNKCIKDFITRYKSMTGYKTPYTPGWDNHGMPIESAIIKQNKLNRKKMSIPEFRDACQEFARNFVQIQMDQFKRLGVLGDWERPYLTMAPKFEAREVQVFGEMFRKGYIYKGKKPVYWCPHDETALAEAEIEYSDHESPSIYVRFNVTDDKGKLGQYCDLSRPYFVIWTTTPWTLPGNLAICLNGELDYVLAKTQAGDVYIVAKGRLEDIQELCGLEPAEILAELKGSEFEFMTARHPLYDRQSLVILGDHVTLDAGTGCVHTAPGHGHEDYDVCHRYDSSGKANIGILVPVDDHGCMTAEAGPAFDGMRYDKANSAICQALGECGALVASETITHQYAHCWRCKQPILYRATDQWFCSVDAFKDQAVASCDDVTWLPEWGHDRMIAMIRERDDWCISRQRHWGLPIPVFYCDDCGEVVCDERTIASVSEVFGKKGSNAWFDLPAEELLPKGYACSKCGGSRFTQETDTLDCWFDSGSTHYASMELDAPGCWPSDMYLEGGDQFRGWFQSSLLTGVATKGSAPYRSVLTHGWTVDGEGKAMHKSLGNSVLPDEVIPKFGADVVRLWAASADYRVDMRCSDNIFKQLSDKYLKIRNTARFILGNLSGFDPNELVPFEDMLPPDQWALTRLNQLVEKCLTSYERFEFFAVTYAVHNFCVVEMSNFYLDILKDRLYCESRDSAYRRSGQSAMYHILDAIVRLLAPILAFTSNEIWLAMPHDGSANPEHVMLNDMPAVRPEWTFDADAGLYWENSLKLRDDVNKALELARVDKIIGKPLDAKVTLYVSDEAAGAFRKIANQHFTAFFIVSEVEVVYGGGEGYPAAGFSGITIKVEPSAQPKCERCWTHSASVGENREHPSLCSRCAAALGTR